VSLIWYCRCSCGWPAIYPFCSAALITMIYMLIKSNHNKSTRQLLTWTPSVSGNNKWLRRQTRCLCRTHTRSHWTRARQRDRPVGGRWRLCKVWISNGHRAGHLSSLVAHGGGEESLTPAFRPLNGHCFSDWLIWCN